MITLRPFQSELLDATRAALPEHRSVLLYAPPGAGKTVISASMAAGAARKRRRVIFACHRRELLMQTSRTFDQFDIQYGYIAASMPANPFASVQIASIDTLRNRYENHPCDLLVVDEAHLSGANTWARIIDHYRDAGAFVVGLSGSPCRLDGKPLKANFRHMIEGPQPAWLIEHGYLSRYRAFAPTQPDMTGIRVRAGDYVADDLDAKFDRPSVIGDAVGAWRKFANGMRTVVYSFSVNHSKHVAATFEAAGIPAAHLDGTTGKTERQAAINRFADGEIKILSSVELLTTGFDLSAQVGRDVPIEAVSLLRPTKSLALAIQMMGRGLRPKQAPAILLDHANVMRDHGLPDDHRVWSLDGAASTKKPGEATMPTCVCANCFGMFRPAYQCPHCGEVREVDGRKIKQVEGELSEIDIKAMRDLDTARDVEFAKRQDRIEEGMAKTVADLAVIAKARKYRVGWLVAKAKARGLPITYNDAVRAMR